MRTVMNKKEELKKAVIESCINVTITIKVAANRCPNQKSLTANIVYFLIFYQL